MSGLHTLWVQQLQDLFDAENQILKALPKMEDAASSAKLKEGFREHLEETEKQVERLEKIAKELDIDLEGKECKGMKGLIEEGEEVLSEDLDDDTRDAALIAAAQKVEHYETAAYGTAVAHAKLMKHREAAKLLQETLDEEGETNKKLTKLAEQSINKEALSEDN